jgi:hypothetical protein
LRPLRAASSLGRSCSLAGRRTRFGPVLALDWLDCRGIKGQSRSICLGGLAHVHRGDGTGTVTPPKKGDGRWLLDGVSGWCPSGGLAAAVLGVAGWLVPVNGTELPYREAGQGPPVLLMHGGGGGWWVWPPGASRTSITIDCSRREKASRSAQVVLRDDLSGPSQQIRPDGTALAAVTVDRPTSGQPRLRTIAVNRPTWAQPEPPRVR